MPFTAWKHRQMGFGHLMYDLWLNSNSFHFRPYMVTRLWIICWHAPWPCCCHWHGFWGIHESFKRLDQWRRVSAHSQLDFQHGAFFVAPHNGWCGHDLVSFFFVIFILGRFKVIHPKYSKHWPYTVGHTIGCVCSKIINHGLNIATYIECLSI